jgi:hypothetical protein
MEVKKDLLLVDLLINLATSSPPLTHLLLSSPQLALNIQLILKDNLSSKLNTSLIELVYSLVKASTIALHSIPFY